MEQGTMYSYGRKMEMADRKPYYPIFLDVAGKRCLVVGGGEIALRKVESLLECGASVRVVSPEAAGRIRDMAERGEVEFVSRAYVRGDIEGAVLVVAATDDREVNRRVAADARAARVIVNAVDDAAASDFISPAVVRRGDLAIAISTGGGSPALARRLREKVEHEFGPEYEALIDLVAGVRTSLLRAGVRVDPDRWQAALDLDRLLPLVRMGRRNEARQALLEGLGVQRA